MKLILVLTQLYITANGSIEILTNLCRSVRLLNTKQISKKIEMVLLFFKEIIMIISSLATARQTRRSQLVRVTLAASARLWRVQVQNFS